MLAGQLRDLITIQSRTAGTPAALGEPVYTWATFVTAYAMIQARRGGEKFDADKGERYSETIYWFTVRREDVVGVMTTMRISFDSQLYDIKDIRPDDNMRDAVTIEATLQNIIVA